MAKVEQKGHALPRERLLELLREMLLVRRFEEKVEERFRAGDLAGFLHVAIGQEAVAVGVCEALEDADVIASTHRAHAHALAKGTHPNELMAELYGKVEGCSRGYGGSMHLYDVEHGNIGANAVVGGGLPAITGAALSFKLRGEPRVAVAFFGDGATNIGTFHESLNLAQLWSVPAVFVCENNGYAESTPAWQQLPIVFVCENNLYMEYTPIGQVTSVTHPAADRAGSYGLEPLIVDGNDPDAMYAAASATLARARAGEGPSLIEAKTYRHGGHSRADPGKYRPDDEVQKWLARDPLPMYRDRLLDIGAAATELDAIDSEVEALVDRATEEARGGPEPGADLVMTDLWADGGSAWRN